MTKGKVSLCINRHGMTNDDSDGDGKNVQLRKIRILLCSPRMGCEKGKKKW